jgi:hypothetical protein
MQHEQRNNQHLGVGQRWWQKEAAKVQAVRPNAARGAPWAGPEVAFERVRAAAQGVARRLDEAYRVANFGQALGSSRAPNLKAGLAKRGRRARSALAQRENKFTGTKPNSNY